MRVLRSSSPFALFIILFLLIACTSTKFSALWKDEAYQGPPGKVLVINAFPKPANRKSFEDMLVKALKDGRVDAVVSYTVMIDPIVSDKEAIAALAKEVGADTVLINKPLGTRMVQSPGVDFSEVHINTKTDVYDMKSNRLVMSVSAATVILQGKSYSDQIQSYVKELATKLSQLGLF